MADENPNPHKTANGGENNLLPGYIHVDPDDPGRWTEEAIDDVIDLAKAMYADPEISSWFEEHARTDQPVSERKGVAIDRFRIDFCHDRGRKVPGYGAKSNTHLLKFFAGEIDSLDSSAARESVRAMTNVYGGIPNYELYG